MFFMSRKFRRLLLPVVLGFLYPSIMPSSVQAEAPMQKTQAPGYYRMMLGQFEVTALFDGIVELDAALLKNISEKDVKELLSRSMIDDPHKLPTSVNAYLINTGSNLVLVDAGSGKALGPTLGYLLKNLKASGYTAEQVDAVLLTHLHSDHVAGLLDADGKPAFPKAVVYVAKAENDYWLSDAEPKNIPPEYQELMKQARKMAHDIAEPYIKLGQWKTFENDLPISRPKGNSNSRPYSRPYGIRNQFGGQNADNHRRHGPLPGGAIPKTGRGRFVRFGR